MNIHHRVVAFSVALVLSGCSAVNTEKEPLRITPKSEVATSPVVREVLPQPSPSPAPPAPPAPVPIPAPTAGNPEASSVAPTLANVAPALSAPTVAPPISVPPGTLYVCNATVNGQLQQTAIEFEPRVKKLCGRHPEMGVCQYEREACRASGGRVFTAAGVEITKQTEAEYDKKVLRVRFRAG